MSEEALALESAVDLGPNANAIAEAEGLMTPARVNALSDGVFSITLTLLTFDVVAAATGGADGVALDQHLRQQWPTLIAYAIGFLTILVCWINHHLVYGYVHRSDAGLLWINGVQLAFVALVPFPTAVLAEHITGDSQDRRTALLWYGAMFFLIAASFWMLWCYVGRRQLISARINPVEARGIGVNYGVSSLWTIACFLVAMVSVIPALAMWTLMFVVFAFPSTFAQFTGRRLSVPAHSQRSTR